MPKPASIVTFLILSLALAGLAGCAPSPGPDAVIPADVYLAHVTWMADDARKGRDTDSPELKQTAEWVGERFEEAGLEPLGADGDWQQPFSVAGQRRLLDGNALRLGDESLALRHEWIPLQTALGGAVEGEVVFAGYGISDPEGGYDDYAGLDVKGKLALVLRRGPDSRTEGSRYRQDGPGGTHMSFATKVNAAFRHGAVALLVVNGPADYEPGSRRDRTIRYGSLGVDGATASLPAAQLSAQAALGVLAAAGLDLAAEQAEIDASGKPRSRPLPGLTAALTIAAEDEQIPTSNVLGLLRGSDPALAHEYVLVGAHMDHVGLGLNRGSRGGPEARGKIHNGADDNASGTAGVVEIARLLADDPGRLRRSIVFAAWSAEEWGLLGSRHYAEHPALPLADCVAVINMDMIGRSQDGYLAVEGVATSPGFKELVVDTERSLQLGFDLALADRASDNSDQASFFERDIPVLNFFTGLHDDYHMPSDDVEKINAQAGAQIATLAGRVAEALAAAEARPLFTRPTPPPPGVVAAAPHQEVAEVVPYRV
ncbi:MAG TPA: M20/M25/M40 family metallo-hydrolase, partial [Planctomycetota bacterium]|nr:M20/M25/M40 family metallo-hydrolase [Planctomycetota bacterium]